MANISVEVMTGDATRSGTPYGHYEVKIFAGLNENPEGVIKEALERVKVSVQSIPPEKRYSKMSVAY